MRLSADLVMTLLAVVALLWAGALTLWLRTVASEQTPTVYRRLESDARELIAELTDISEKLSMRLAREAKRMSRESKKQIEEAEQPPDQPIGGFPEPAHNMQDRNAWKVEIRRRNGWS